MDSHNRPDTKQHPKNECFTNRIGAEEGTVGLSLNQVMYVKMYIDYRQRKEQSMANFIST